MSKSTPSPPPAPNPTTVANAQQGSNIGTAIAGATLNNTNQNTPYGSTSYNQTGGYTDPTTGQFVPQFTQTNTLSPQLQDLFNQSTNYAGGQIGAANQLLPAQTGLSLAQILAQTGLVPQQSGLASSQIGMTQAQIDAAKQLLPQQTALTQGQLQTQLGLLPGESQLLQGNQNLGLSMLPIAQNLVGRAGQSTSQPLDFSGANNDYIQGGPQALDKTTADAIYKQQAGFLDPQWSKTQQDMNDQLSQQGIPVGSPAWNTAMTQFNNSKTQAYNAASNSATAQAVPAAASMFGMALQGQQQNIGQQQLAQSNPLQLLSQLYGSGVA